jgi:cyclohexyl-isocyanide hydratase
VPLKVSVCTGALLLGATGFLRRRATTHPASIASWSLTAQRWCGKGWSTKGEVITAGGVSASIDLGLHLVEKLAGAQARERIAAQMDYPTTAWSA